jgi:hypothetical protein
MKAQAGTRYSLGVEIGVLDLDDDALEQGLTAADVESGLCQRSAPVKIGGGRVPLGDLRISTVAVCHRAATLLTQSVSVAMREAWTIPCGEVPPDLGEDLRLPRHPKRKDIDSTQDRRRRLSPHNPASDPRDGGGRNRYPKPPNPKVLERNLNLDLPPESR